MMMEKIKSRPLSHYYLWKVFQRVEKDPTRELIIPPLKTVIGQLNAERRNLEKVNSEILAKAHFKYCIFRRNVENCL